MTNTFYAYTLKQLHEIAEVVEATNADKRDFFFRVQVVDPEDMTVVGNIEYDENGVYGFIPQSEHKELQV